MDVLTAWICPEFIHGNKTKQKRLLLLDPLLLVPQACHTRGHQRASPITATKPWLPLLPPAKSKPHTSQFSNPYFPLLIHHAHSYPTFWRIIFFSEEHLRNIIPGRNIPTLTAELALSGYEFCKDQIIVTAQHTNTF